MQGVAVGLSANTYKGSHSFQEIIFRTFSVTSACLSDGAYASDQQDAVY